MSKSMGNGQWAMLIIVISGLLFCTTAVSQKVSTILSKEKIVLGEQISLQIKIDGITKDQIQQDFQFPDTVNHLEILKDSVEEIGNAVIHNLTITSFDSGYWQFPSYKLLLADKRTLSTEPLNITVLPVDISNMQDYHDIKDILPVTAENNWWIIATIILLAIIGLFGVLWFMNNKVIIPEQKKITPQSFQHLYATLLERLKQLESTDLQRRHTVLKLFEEASQSTRDFIDKAYYQNTFHLTTGEYILKMKTRFPNAETEGKYFQFLRLADAVKFAKYLPPVEDSQAIFPVLRNVVSEVFNQTKPTN